MRPTIGIRLSRGLLDGQLGELESWLRHAADVGFDAVEIPILGVDAIIGVRVQRERLAQLQATTSQFALRYSVHVPNFINLAHPTKTKDGPDLSRELAVLRACLEVAGAIGAEVVVYHCGIEPTDGTFARVRERQGLVALAADCKSSGIVIAVENTSQSLEELGQHLDGIDAQSVGITLDLAHLCLAAEARGFNAIESIDRCSNLVAHLHLNDNFVRPHSSEGFERRLVYGDGDLHLPPGWGSLPQVEPLRALGHYEGQLILEISKRFCDMWHVALASTKSNIELASRVAIDTSPHKSRDVSAS